MASSQTDHQGNGSVKVRGDCRKSSMQKVMCIQFGRQNHIPVPLRPVEKTNHSAMAPTKAISTTRPGHFDLPPKSRTELTHLFRHENTVWSIGKSHEPL